jgi:RNA polymerase sigma-70 factor, ECF subfamily
MSPSAATPVACSKSSRRAATDARRVASLSVHERLRSASIALSASLAEGDLAGVVRAARQGGAAAAPAFAEIHRRFVRVVHGIALARVGRMDAEDVTQEVFVRVHRALPTLRDAAAFPAWICQVARSVATDHLRSARRRPAAAPLPEDRAAPAAPASDDELRERALAALARLPEAYRETLLLRLAEGLSGPEIAARCGMTPDSVRVNLSRGMVLLRPLLRAEGWQ